MHVKQATRNTPPSIGHIEPCWMIWPYSMLPWHLADVKLVLVYATAVGLSQVHHTYQRSQHHCVCNGYYRASTFGCRVAYRCIILSATDT